MSNTRRKPVRLLGLAGKATAWPWQGRLTFSWHAAKPEGPAQVTDGRICVTMLEGPELGDVLGSIPASVLDPGSMMALSRVIDMLNVEPSRFTGVRKDDLATLLTATADDPAPAKVLARLREAAGLEPAAAAADGGQ